jgi:hypothetical protein
MPNPPKDTVVIEDAYGNTITMKNGKITIGAVGALELTAPVVTINGRVVLPNNTPI